MKLKETSFAHAVAIVAAGSYIFCVLLIATMPSVYESIMTSWFHGIDVSTLWSKGLQPMPMIFWGLMTFTAFTWITAFAFACVYNKLVK